MARPAPFIRANELIIRVFSGRGMPQSLQAKGMIRINHHHTIGDDYGQPHGVR